MKRATYNSSEVEEIVANAMLRVISSSQNLNNVIYPDRWWESEEEIMSKNKSKIRRPITINGTQVWVSADSEQEYADKILQLHNGSAPGPKEKHLFRTYAENWFETYSKPNITPVTVATYERQLNNHIYPILGDLYLEDITTDDIQRLFNKMGNKVAKATKLKVKIVLNQIFKMAYEKRAIDRNPMLSTSLKISGKESEETQPYTVEQMQFLAEHLSELDDPEERAWLALSISLPLRPEEVLGLQWKHLDTEKGMVLICNTVTHPHRSAPSFQEYTKTDSSRRSLYLPKETLSYLPQKGEPDDFVVGGKEAISYTRLRTIRKHIEKKLGFDDKITPRRFRTTVATDISAETHNIKLVQQMLGHASPEITLKYYDKGRDTVVDASDAISKCYKITHVDSGHKTC